MKHLALVALVLSSFFAQAQNFSKTGVLNMRLRNSGSIIQDDQVKGYYFFYKLDKKDKKNHNYLLSVYDENLNEISSVNIARPVSYALIDGAFNGNAFAFMFYDARTRNVELISYDSALHESGSFVKVANRLSQATLNTVAMGTEPSQSYIVPVTRKGFLVYGIKEGKKYQYEISFFNNSLSRIWMESAPVDALPVELASEAFQSSTYIGSTITQQKKAGSKDIQTTLLVQDIATGKVQFRAPMETSKYSVSFSYIHYDEPNQNFIVFGEYYDKNVKEMKAQSLGFIYLTLDSSGKIIGEKLNSWANEISRATPMTASGKFEGTNTNVLFHDILRTRDGQIFVIGEQYKKAASASGIASQILTVAAMAALGGGYYGANQATVQLNVYNMLIFQFNPDFTINKVHVFEKDKNVVLLPSGASYSTSKTLSYYARAIGGFDFAYSQASADKETFVVTYINYDREKGQQSKNVLGAIVYTPEHTFTVDKLPLNRKSTEYFVYRAKEGYVLVTEYFRKEKRLDTRLEKLNY